MGKNIPTPEQTLALYNKAIDLKQNLLWPEAEHAAESAVSAFESRLDAGLNIDSLLYRVSLTILAQCQHARNNIVAALATSYKVFILREPSRWPRTLFSRQSESTLNFSFGQGQALSTQLGTIPQILRDCTLRYFDLSFYSDTRLWFIHNPKVNYEAFWMLESPKQLWELNMDPEVIFEANAIIPLELNKNNVASYFTFYGIFDWLHKSPSYILADNKHPALQELSPLTPKEMLEQIQSIKIRRSRSPGAFICTSYSVFDKKLYRSRNKIWSNGSIDVLEDTLVWGSLEATTTSAS